MFENPRRGRQARNFTKNVPKILDIKSSSEQIFSENCRWVPLDTVYTTWKNKNKKKQTRKQTNKQLLFVQSAPVKEYYGVFR